MARALLKRVASFARETDALTVKLATAVSNQPAKLLYESEGYQKVIAFDHYTQRVGARQALCVTVHEMNGKRSSGEARVSAWGRDTG